MHREAVSKRYAKALFEIGVEKKSVEALRGELEFFKNLALSGSMLFLINPVFSNDEKEKVVEELFKKNKTSKDFQSFFTIIMGAKRSELIPEIYEYFEKFLNDYLEQEVANVYSAVKLSSAQISSLEKALLKVRKKKVAVENIIEESLIGGMRVEIGSLVYDGSVKGSLDKFLSGAAAGSE